MESSETRSHERAVPKSRWKQWLKTVAHLGAACALFTGGVIYTVGQEHPRFQQPAESIAVTRPTTGQPYQLFRRDVIRVASVLKQYTRDSSTAEKIAGVIVDEGKRRNLDPALLVGVLLTEDGTLDTMARSNVGARGLMQVMPVHSGKWGCGSANLFDIASNICHGASILQDAIRNAPSMRVALLRYNGCVRGSNTPHCHTYPDKVLRAASRTTAQLIALSN